MIIDKIRIAEAWVQAEPQTLRGVGWDGFRTPDNRPVQLITASLTPEQFERYRAEHLRQYRQRLGTLRFREDMRNRNVEGLDVEYKFQSLARRLRRMPRKIARSLHYGIASSLQTYFSQEQLNIIFRLLDDIEDKLPWDGISYTKLWEAVYQHEPDRAPVSEPEK